MSKVKNSGVNSTVDVGFEPICPRDERAEFVKQYIETNIQPKRKYAQPIRG